MSFTLTINPVLLSLGPFEIRYYGLVYVIGFILAYVFLKKFKDHLGFKDKDIDEFLIWLFVGVILGSRLFEVIVWNPSYYFANPLKIFAVWEGGMAFHGGLIGAGLVAYWYSKKNNISLAKLVDVIVFPAIIALALGRIANFINGELVGTVTNVPWCVNFPGYDECRHPSQLYGALKRFIILGVLVLLYNHKKHKDGFIFCVFVALMGIGRFFLDFYRDDIRYLGLSLGQYFGLIMFIVSGYILIKYYWRKDK